MSQPGVSRTIDRLERTVGARLFHRSKQGLIPTAAGKMLLHIALDLCRRHTGCRLRRISVR
uniref:LysR family transcriptional regulator n=1 Tax=Rhodococcus erythropolis TaxID=1833 RepID=UPI00345EF610